MLYIACIVELPKDKTSLNSNAPNKITRGDKIRSRAENFTIGYVLANCWGAKILEAS